MCNSWDTAYLWENAEAALAWLEAYEDTKKESYLRDALTVLRAIAKHHHGRYGFLTEVVDWSNPPRTISMAPNSAISSTRTIPEQSAHH